MNKTTTTVILCAALVILSGPAFAGAQAKMKAADEAPEQIDPKKKKAGEECKATDECQKHHQCVKSGEKGVCTAPPRRSLPPGVVT